MANTIRIKRRASGNAGAPSSLLNAELAFNEVGDVLYYGKGTGSNDAATSVEPIAGKGAFVSLGADDQTIGGNKTFSNTITGSISGNAGTATTLQTGRNFSITGDVSASAVSFNGSSAVELSATLANSGVSAGTYNGTATEVKPFTVDAKGRITGVGNAVTITPAFSSITSTPTTLSGYGITDAVSSTLLGANNGVATLDSAGKVPSTQLPSYVDDVLEYDNLAGFPGTGEAGKIYVAKDTGKVYRWSGSVYVEISSAATADVAVKLQTARTITATGDASWEVSFDGSANVSASLTLSSSGVSAGTYNDSATAVRPFTVDAKGRVTAVGTAVTITPAWSSITSTPTTLAGYGITDAQAKDATLTALAGVSTAADKLIYATGSDTFSTTDLTSFGRSLIDDADNTAARSTLGLGSIATQAANNVSISGGSITGITDLAVADGGTGVSSLTGIVKGNGTSAFSAAVAGTDYLAPDSTVDGGTF